VNPPSADSSKGTLSAGTVVRTPAGELIADPLKTGVPDTGTGQPRYIVIAVRPGAMAARSAGQSGSLRRREETAILTWMGIIKKPS
jgi:hypothetical protein